MIETVLEHKRIGVAVDLKKWESDVKVGKHTINLLRMRTIEGNPHILSTEKETDRLNDIYHKHGNKEYRVVWLEGGGKLFAGRSKSFGGFGAHILSKREVEKILNSIDPDGKIKWYLHAEE